MILVHKNAATLPIARLVSLCTAWCGVCTTNAFSGCARVILSCAASASSWSLAVLGVTASSDSANSCNNESEHAHARNPIEAVSHALKS